jgi:mycothiol synthase
MAKLSHTGVVARSAVAPAGKRTSQAPGSPSKVTAMDLVRRPVTPDDVPAWLRLLAAAEAVDATGESYDAEDLLEELHDPTTGIDDRLAVFDGAEMIAFAGVRWRGVTTYQRIDAEGVVHPEWRGQGLGTTLVEWIVDRSTALQPGARPSVETRIRCLGFLRNHGQVRLLEDHGFRQVNWSAVMRLTLPTADPPPVWPPGLSLHTYERAWSQPTREAHNAAFAEHWGFMPWSAELWERWVDGTKNARPELSWVVVDDADPDTVVAYLHTNEFEANAAVRGKREAYLAKLGVRPEYRGRGLAAALLAQASREYAAHGYDEASLDVDTNNPTGAFGLYERAGYRVDNRTATFERVIAIPA